MHNNPENIEELKADVEARQRATCFPDTLETGGSVDAFLWKGDPKAKPVQRAGLIVFGILFFLLGVAIASIPFQKDFEDGSPMAFLLALGCLYVAFRLLHNAFRRPSANEEIENENHDL